MNTPHHFDLGALTALAGRLHAKHAQATQTARNERESLQAVTQAHADSVQAQEIIQQLAQGMQQHAHTQIAGLVTRCLAAVYDEPYQFLIHFEAKRGKTEARFAFARDGNEVDPLTASGGGMVDVAAFALRVSAIMLSRPRVRRLMLLDEPFRFVSRRFHPALVELVTQLENELEIQFLMVTHIPELSIGTRIAL